MDQIAASGLKFDFIADPGTTPATNVAAIANFLEAHPGSVSLVEGPNEPNNFGVDYAGLSGIAGAQAWQRDFYAALKANPITAAITVAGVASYPLVAVASDENNLHLYPNDGNQLGFELAAKIADQARVDPGKGFAITELGWATQPGAAQAGSDRVGVDEATQAKLVVTAYLDAISAGATHVGLYDLRDWSGADFDAHYGLFRNDDTPKLAATALHDVQAILGGGAAAADGFVPGALDYSMTAPGDVRSLLMQQASGAFVLALWREADVWDQAAGTPNAVAGEGVTLRLATSADATVYDPVLGSAAVAAAATTRDVSVTLTDRPVFVVLTPNANAAAPAPNLIVNGSFEAGPTAGAFTTLDAGSTALDGWTVTQGSVDAIHGYWQAADGTSSLDMNGNAPGTIAQTFATVAGQQYDVRFSLAANPDDQGVHGLRVSAAGASEDFTFDGAGHGHDAMGWVAETFHFTATGNATTLAFAGLDAGYTGAALDDVRVTAAAGAPAESQAAPTPSAPAAPAPNLIVNGSFEAGPTAGSFTTLDAGSTALDGWTVTQGSVDAIHGYWQAADGTSSLDMNGNAPGAIAQTFATTPGQQYDVRFSLAANPDDQSLHGLRVSAAGASEDFTFDGAGHAHDAMGWVAETFHFTATGSTTTLAFAGLDAGYTGAALDDVSVTAAPNLIVNGSFEAGPTAGAFTTLGTGSTALDGWTVTQGSVDAIHGYWQAADGTSSLDMNGNAPGTIAQTFATTAGQQYDVRFSLAANPDDQSVHGLSVSAAGASQNFTFDGAGHSHDAMGWVDETFRFTATESVTTLAFAGLDAGYTGAALDHVSVTPADIHATYSPFVM